MFDEPTLATKTKNSAATRRRRQDQVSNLRAPVLTKTRNGSGFMSTSYCPNLRADKLAEGKRSGSGIAFAPHLRRLIFYQCVLASTARHPQPANFCSKKHLLRRLLATAVVGTGNLPEACPKTCPQLVRRHGLNTEFHCRRVNRVCNRGRVIARRPTADHFRGFLI